MVLNVWLEVESTILNVKMDLGEEGDSDKRVINNINFEDDPSRKTTPFFVIFIYFVNCLYYEFRGVTASMNNCGWNYY